MTFSVRGSILHAIRNISAMTRKSTRKECYRELPVDARQCRASVGRSSPSFPAEWACMRPSKRERQASVIKGRALLDVH